MKERTKSSANSNGVDRVKKKSSYTEKMVYVRDALSPRPSVGQRHEEGSRARDQFRFECKKKRVPVVAIRELDRGVE